MTVTTAAMRNDTQTVVEADHLVLLRLLLVLLATFGLNRTPNLLSRNFLDKRSGPKCTVASIWIRSHVAFLFSFVSSFLFLGSFLLEFLAGKDEIIQDVLLTLIFATSMAVCFMSLMSI